MPCKSLYPVNVRMGTEKHRKENRHLTQKQTKRFSSAIETMKRTRRRRKYVSLRWPGGAYFTYGMQGMLRRERSWCWRCRGWGVRSCGGLHTWGSWRWGNFIYCGQVCMVRRFGFEYIKEAGGCGEHSGRDVCVNGVGIRMFLGQVFFMCLSASFSCFWGNIRVWRSFNAI